MVRLFLFTLLAASLLTACSSGKTAFKRGRFDLAVKNASKRLQQRPGLSKRGHLIAAQVLQQAFVQAYEQHQVAIRRLSGPKNTINFRWEQVYQEYEQLQTLTDNARRGFVRRGFARQRLVQPCDTCANWLAKYPASYQGRLRDT